MTGAAVRRHGHQHAGDVFAGQLHVANGQDFAKRVVGFRRGVTQVHQHVGDVDRRFDLGAQLVHVGSGGRRSGIGGKGGKGGSGGGGSSGGNGGKGGSGIDQRQGVGDQARHLAFGVGLFVVVQTGHVQVTVSSKQHQCRGGAVGPGRQSGTQHRVGGVVALFAFLAARVLHQHGMGQLVQNGCGDFAEQR